MPDKQDKHIHRLDLYSDRVAYCTIPNCGLELSETEWTETYGADLFEKPPAMHQKNPA